MRRRDLFFGATAAAVAVAALLLLKPWPVVGAVASLAARRVKALERWSWLLLLASALSLLGSVDLSILRYVHL